jgi:AmiR/NasT family two-component response regulator
MVMAQLGLRPEDALALLRAHAYADNTSLNEVSQAVIERRLDFVVSD